MRLRKYQTGMDGGALVGDARVENASRGRVRVRHASEEDNGSCVYANRKSPYGNRSAGWAFPTPKKHHYCG